MNLLDQAPLGQNCNSIETYTPTLLYSISRRFTRSELKLPEALPFFGADLWNAYELSWLTPTGQPQIGYGIFTIQSSSPSLIESKSLKLYLNSFNQTVFENTQQVKSTIENDLTYTCGQAVQVEVITPPFPTIKAKDSWKHAFCLDTLSVTTNSYTPSPDLLKFEEEVPSYEEKLCTHLFKSKCLKTGQPDWASVYIHYKGPKINRSALLKYFISFRNHKGFHEQCVEKMFNDIFQRCYLQYLTVYARFTRRGGLDINPFRSNFQVPSENDRLFRQ